MVKRSRKYNSIMWAQNFQKSFIPCLLLVVILSACGESATSEKEPGTASVSTDSVQSNPYLLAASDLADDSVFGDGTRPVSWENAGVTDPVAMKTFIRKLQVWVRDNHVDSISSYLRYPMRNPGIKDKGDFKLNYSNYFSDGVKAALAEQRLSQVFRNEQGVMIGQGQIWLREENNNIQIIAINN